MAMDSIYICLLYQHAGNHILPATDSAMQDNDARRVLRKIDRQLIPLLFVTYAFNFMDKTILSSASVFGLLEDNVSRLQRVYVLLLLTHV